MLHLTLFPTLHALYLYISTFLSLYAAPKYGCFLQFLNFVPSGMLLRYFVNDFQLVPVAPTINFIRKHAHR